MSNLTIKLEGQEQANYIKEHFGTKEVPKTALKFYSRLNMFKGNNVSFNPKTKTAKSYNWWEFVKVIGGKLVFNHYHYSQSTSKHQSKVRNLLDQLNIPVDIYVEAPKGLQNLDDSIKYMGRRIATLELEQSKGKKKSWAYENRSNQIKAFRESISELQEALV